MATLQDFVNRLSAVERGTDTNGNHRYHADCPFCGKPMQAGQNHFYFSELGFKCWVCGAEGHLGKLAQQLNLPRTEHKQTPKKAQAPKPVTVYPDTLVQAYTVRSERYDSWWQYRRLNRETVDRYSLGIGKLPEQHTERLIMPVRRRGQWIGLRGRALNGDKPKWLNAAGSGSMFYCPGGWRVGGTLFITENMADSLLLRQCYPDYDAGAPTCGVSSWQDVWSEFIARRPPKLIVLAFDADWQTKPPVRAATMKTLASLRRVGLAVEIFDWSRYPYYADIGDLLMDKKQE